MTRLYRIIGPIALTIGLLAPGIAQAKGPCDTSYAKKQLSQQIHQLDRQKQQINRQYRGERNEGARRSALAQVDAQRDGLEAQMRGLREQKEERKEARKHRR